jgi:hypothetical protein
MTRADLLEDNVDLLAHCSGILAAVGRRAPARRVHATADDVIDLTTTRRRRTRHRRTTRGT